MERLFCINRRVVFVTIVAIIAIGGVIVSEFILKTDTKYNSRASEKKSKAPIIGGNNALKSDWPFMVRVYRYYDGSTTPNRYCGGSLIAPGWVLTAAHCVYGPDHRTFKGISSIVVKAESYKLDLAKEYFLFDTNDFEKSIFVHKDYGLITNKLLNFVTGSDRFFARYDVALIRLNAIPNADTITIQQSKDQSIEFFGSALTTLGWGGSLEDEVLPLQEAIIPLLTSRQDINKIMLNDNSEFIAGYPSGEVTACGGDSGGPAIVWNGERWVQIGITAHMVGNCGEKGSYVVYAYIPNFAQWIIDTIQRNDSKDDYMGVGTYIGKPYSESELSFYTTKLCELEDWGNDKPEYCSN